jgi:iron complex transport system substrate-binding protein
MKLQINRFVPVLLVAALLIGLTGCTPAVQPEKTSLTLMDGLGRTVTLVSVPQKIISLSPSNTEMLFAVGAGKQVIGRDEFSDYPEEAKTLPSVGGSMGKINLEQVAALQPDLVLAAQINTPEQVKALDDLNLTVYYLPNPKNIDELYTVLSTVGQLTGHEQETQSLVDSLKNRVTAVLALPKPDTNINVYYELDGSDAAKPWTPGKGSYIDDLLTMAGGKNIGSEAGEGWVQMSQEAIIALNPQVILLGDSAYGITPELVSQRTGWDIIDAVQNNRVYPFDDNLVSRPGPRLVDGLERLAELIRQ